MFRSLYSSIFKKPISLSSIKQVVKKSYDSHNLVPEGNTFISFLSNEKEIGYVSYRPHNGQIGIIRLDDEYRGRTLGEQILLQIISELKEKGVKELWAVTTFDHPFWSKTLNNGMKWRKPAHSSVTGGGYYIEI